MNQEHHRWYSHRLGREMGLRVHGHYGSPILVFPTSGGDEWEYENQGMIAALGHHVDAGRVKFFGPAVIWRKRVLPRACRGMRSHGPGVLSPNARGPRTPDPESGRTE